MTILLGPGCTSKTEETRTNIIEDDVIPIEHNYSEVEEYQIVWDKMFDVELTTYYVYFYSTTCSHCQELKNYIIEKALDNKNIFFVRASNKDQITNDPKKIKFAENPGDIWILGYPSLVKIVEKKSVKNLAGITQIKTELK